MAQKIVTTLVDDLDGTEIAPGRGETVRFGLDGATFEIDLTDANAARLRDALAPYLGRARKVGSAASAARTGRKAATTDLAAIRSWWRSQGNEIGDRGRVPQAIIDAYESRR